MTRFPVGFMVDSVRSELSLGPFTVLLCFLKNTLFMWPRPDAHALHDNQNGGMVAYNKIKK